MESAADCGETQNRLLGKKKLPDSGLGDLTRLMMFSRERHFSLSEKTPGASPGGLGDQPWVASPLCPENLGLPSPRAGSCLPARTTTRRAKSAAWGRTANKKPTGRGHSGASLALSLVVLRKVWGYIGCYTHLKVFHCCCCAWSPGGDRLALARGGHTQPP